MFLPESQQLDRFTKHSTIFELNTGDLVLLEPVPQDKVETDFQRRHEPHAVKYWEVRKRVMEIAEDIPFGAQISQDHLNRLGQIDIACIENSALNTNSFKFRSRDRLPIGSVTYPGKSAFVDPTRFLNTDFCNLPPNLVRLQIERLRQSLFGVEYDRRDNLYIAPLQKFWEYGFTAFWSPIQTNPLHVRLVHESALDDDPRFVDDTPWKQFLPEIFQKVPKTDFLEV